MEFNNNYNQRRLGDVKNALKKLGEDMNTKIIDLSIQVAVTKEPVPFSDRLELEYKEFNIGDSWGRLFECGWFRLSGQIPINELDQKLFLKFDVSGEGLLFDEQGNVLKGFTNGSSVFDRNFGEPGKCYYPINELIDEKGGFECYLDCGANDLFGSLQDNGVIVDASIVKREVALEEAYYDYEALIAIQENDGDSYESLIDELYALAAKINYSEKDVVESTNLLVKKYLNKKAEEDFTIYGIGHAHIDLAWLWPIRETRRKGARTLANVFYLIEKYDEFIFGISQPQLVEWLRMDYPDVFEQLKKYVKAGRIEVQGGMWVEADTNVTGEEALVRQMLYGKRYWKEVFDKDVRSVWLPDVFGYTASLPQIIKKSDMDYFMTIKLSWSLVNVFPYHTFNWYGIDHSRVLVHMPPEGNYNSSATRQYVKKTYDNYREKEVSNQALMLYGIGDGGGGPGEEHVERIYRNNRTEKVKEICFATSESFFRNLEKKRPLYPEWNGELYLENHQGTYTSQAEVKRFNRLMENKLKMTEAILVSLGCVGFEKRLEAIWKEVLLYQFHDILPGSSIKRVYDECLERYRYMEKALDDILEEATDNKLCDSYDDGRTIFNSNATKSRVYSFGEEGLYKIDIAALSTKVLAKKYYQSEVKDFNGRIETDQLMVQFNPNGSITSVIDKKTNRELVVGAANQLNIYKDYGNAWDIRDDYRMQTPLNWKLVGRKYKTFGENIHQLEQHYTFGQSTLKENILIDGELREIEFSHELDWQDMGYMMRTEFPLTIESDEATFDIQFGQFARSRKNDTSVRKAQFEMCGHNWVDVSEEGLGCSFLNTGKYGYYIKDNVIDMNLIRSTSYPAQDGDIGKTSYKYKLLIHDGDLEKASVDSIGQSFNSVYPIFEKEIDLLEPLFTIDDGIAYSAIKRGENGKSIILRLYERHGKKVHVKIGTKLSYQEVVEVDMIENIVNKNINIENIAFEPFEIKTVCFML